MTHHTLPSSALGLSHLVSNLKFLAVTQVYVGGDGATVPPCCLILVTPGAMDTQLVPTNKKQCCPRVNHIVLASDLVSNPGSALTVWPRTSPFISLGLSTVRLTQFLLGGPCRNGLCLLPGPGVSAWGVASFEDTLTCRS